MRKIMFLMILFILVGCGKGETQMIDEAINLELGSIGQNDVISRAEVCKMLSLTKYNINEIETMDRTINFKDTSIDKWYDKYINSSFNAQLISGTTDVTFSPDDFLSLYQAQFLLAKLDSTGTLKIKYDAINKDKPISYAMWTEVFKKAIPDLNSVGISEENFIIVATKMQCEELGDRYIMTNKGLYSCDGMDLTQYCNKEIKALVKQNEMLIITELTNNTPTLMEVDIIDVNEGYVRVKVAGCERAYSYIGSDVKAGDKVNITIEGNVINSINTP